MFYVFGLRYVNTLMLAVYLSVERLDSVRSSVPDLVASPTEQCAAMEFYWWSRGVYWKSRDE